jgi:hypothetical protein
MTFTLSIETILILFIEIQVILAFIMLWVISRRYKVRESNNEEKLHCDECEGEVIGSMSYCPHCGIKFEDETSDKLPTKTLNSKKSNCPECGERFEFGDVYCCNCGKKMGSIKPKIK